MISGSSQSRNSAGYPIRTKSIFSGLIPSGLRRKILGNGEGQMRKNVLWNMVGSILMAAATIVLMSVAGRTAGEDGGALYTAAYTMAQQLLAICYFEVRAIQVTDLEDVHSFSDYFSFRLLTCAVMLACGFLYAAVSGGGAVRFSVVILVVAYKMLDGFAEVFEGEFQKRERLDLSGISMTFRMVFSVGAFIAAAYATGNLVVACLCALLASSVAVLLFDLALVEEFSELKIRFVPEQMKGIWKDCFLLFIGNFITLYVTNAAKYASHLYLNDADYYLFTAVIFMPANMINLVSNFLFRPLLTTMRRNYLEQDYPAFEKLIALLFGGILVVTLLGVAGAALLGKPVLELVYPVQMEGHVRELLLMMLGGGGFAGSIILYYIYAVMRRQKELCIGYVAAAVITLPVPFLLTRNAGIFGAALSYVLLMTIQMLLLGIGAFLLYRTEKRHGGSGENN